MAGSIGPPQRVTAFSAHPENLATEALNYVLRRTPSARAALIQFCAIGASLPPDLAFQTQVAGDDQTIPDLVGTDADNVARLVIEAKFWAGLTERQPVQYLQRVRQGGMRSSLGAWTVPFWR